MAPPFDLRDLPLGRSLENAQGVVRHLFLAVERGKPMRPVPEARVVAQRGLEGDRHAAKRSGGKRQVLLADAADIEALKLQPGTLKENIVLAGVPLESFPPGQRLRLGPEVTVELSEACTPCHKLNLIRPGLLSESWGRRGQLARVLSGGILRTGDGVWVLDVNPDAPRVIWPKLP